METTGITGIIGNMGLYGDYRAQNLLFRATGALESAI